MEKFLFLFLFHDLRFPFTHPPSTRPSGPILTPLLNWTQSEVFVSPLTNRLLNRKSPGKTPDGPLSSTGVDVVFRHLQGDL